MQQALEALEEISDDYADRFDLHSPSTNPGIKSSIKLARDAFTSLRAALEAQQESVALPDGLSRSDAEFWLSRRTQIIEACRAQGFSIVTTAHGTHLMRLGKIEAQSAHQPAQPQGWVLVPEEPTPEMVEIGAGVIDDNGGNARWADIREAWGAMLAARPQPKETT
jgi:hypothetical protein